LSASQPPRRHNVYVTEANRHLQVIPSSASPEEAAAIVAAIERFMRATAPPPRQPARARDGWHEAAILEGVAREPHRDLPDPWINT
jgi:hypothetical protein